MVGWAELGNPEAVPYTGECSGLLHTDGKQQIQALVFPDRKQLQAPGDPCSWKGDNTVCLGSPLPSPRWPCPRWWRGRCGWWSGPRGPRWWCGRWRSSWESGAGPGPSPSGLPPQPPLCSQALLLNTAKESQGWSWWELSVHPHTSLPSPFHHRAHREASPMKGTMELFVMSNTCLSQFCFSSFFPLSIFPKPNFTSQPEGKQTHYHTAAARSSKCSKKSNKKHPWYSCSITATRELIVNSRGKWHTEMSKFFRMTISVYPKVFSLTQISVMAFYCFFGDFTSFYFFLVLILSRYLKCFLWFCHSPSWCLILSFSTDFHGACPVQAHPDTLTAFFSAFQSLIYLMADQGSWPVNTSSVWDSKAASKTHSQIFNCPHVSALPISSTCKSTLWLTYGKLNTGEMPGAAGLESATEILAPNCRSRALLKSGLWCAQMPGCVNDNKSFLS